MCDFSLFMITPVNSESGVIVVIFDFCLTFLILLESMFLVNWFEIGVLDWLLKIEIN